MKIRQLGRQGLQVSELGLGCMGMSDFYTTSRTSEAEAIALIHRGLDLGINFLDTSDMYGPYSNEILLGKALRDRRDGVVVATKFGLVREPGSASLGANGRPEHVRASCEGSLQRLGVEYIDVYYQHRVDPAVPIEETVGAMADLVRQGKVKYIGLSEAAPATIRRAHKVFPISVLQTEYSLWSRDPEDQILPALRELGIGFVPYSPLGRGFLTGRFRRFEDLAPDDYRRRSPRFQGDNFAKNLALVTQIEAIAREKGCTASQLALAWLLAQGEHIVPIPGTTSLARVEENASVPAIALGAPDLVRIEAVAPRNCAAGDRYPAATARLLDG
ncbi:MAG: aldo/keto reductase [Steroidobacterales bacterium]